MTTVVWIMENTWQGCVDAARQWLPPGRDVVLLHVSPTDVGAVASGSRSALLGRAGHRHPHLPGPEELAAQAAEELLAAAADRLGRPARREARLGRVEQEVVAAAQGAELLVVARDGDRSRLGPRSLGARTRFVVDHAPCPVLLVWPGDTPPIDLPPPPPRPRRN